MNDTQPDSMIRLAKLVESLSSCPRLQDTMFLALVKHHEISNTVCSKYFYDIYLHMQKDVAANIYKLNYAEINFLENCDITSDLVDETLSEFNRSANVVGNDVYHDSFLAVVRQYTRSQYKYIFLPVIADYSVDASLVHQCALIIDLRNNIFLFYEPYGVYAKYNASYIPAVIEFLSQYSLPAIYYGADGKLRFDTWHNYFGLTTGIQSILLKVHNASYREYENDKNKYMSDLKKISPLDYSKLDARLKRRSDLPVHKDDLTFDTMDIAAYFSEHDVDTSAEENALRLYYKYNSKTCVTITITELNYFFGNLADLSHEEQSSKLRYYYNDFAEQKNYKLFNQLDEFIRITLNSDEVYKLADSFFKNKGC